MDLRHITTSQAGVAQSSAYRNLNKLFSGMLKDHDMTSMQWFIIGTIYDAGSDGIQLTKLAAKLQTGLPFITNTINLLESKEMVERKNSDIDSRSKTVSIAPAFEANVRQIEQDLRAKMRSSIYATISPKDLQTYIKVLYQIGSISPAD